MQQEYFYEIHDGLWALNGTTINPCENLGVIYEKADPYDKLLVHGPFNLVEEIFLSDEYSKLSKTGKRLRLINVPQKEIKLLNMYLEHLNSKLCSILDQKVSPDDGTYDLPD